MNEVTTLEGKSHEVENAQRIAILEEQYTGLRRDVDSLAKKVDSGFATVTAQMNDRLDRQQEDTKKQIEDQKTFFQGQYNGIIQGLFKIAYILIGIVGVIAGATQAAKLFG